MKTILTVMIVLTTFWQQSIAQASRPEFILSLSENQLEIKPGEVKTIAIKILRAKGYTKSKAKLGLSSSLPEGITLTYEPAEGVMESSKATISVSSGVKQGTYVLLPECTLNNKRKGTMLKLLVTANVSEVSKLE